MRFFLASGCPIATTTRYRCVHLAEQLRALGHDADIAEWFADSQIEPALAEGYDAIFLYRLPMSEPLARVIASARAADIPIIFDTDDLIFEPELVHAQRGMARLSAAEQEQHTEGVRRYLQTLQACDAVTTATPFLAELARQRGQQAFVHRNSLGLEMHALADELFAKRKTRTSDRVVIGYGSGTPTHDVDFEEAAAALEIVLDRFPETELWIVGPLAVSDRFDVFSEQVKRFELTDWRGWFERASQFDIALAPLERENVFCRAKSEIKFVEAGALGVPVVASQTEPFADAITHRINGLLAADKGDWVRELSWLLEDAERRTTLGHAARASVLKSYSPEARTADLAKILPRLLEARTENGAAPL